MAGVDYAGESATQAIYTNEWAPYRAQYGATTSLSDIDFYCGYGCPADWTSHFWQDQFSSLYALSSIGMSYYNAGQITLRHPTSHGLTMDFSYTLSKSIDFGSDTERSNEFGDERDKYRLIQRNPQHLETLPEPRRLRFRHASLDHCRCGVQLALRARERHSRGGVQCRCAMQSSAAGNCPASTGGQADCLSR